MSLRVWLVKLFTEREFLHFYSYFMFCKISATLELIPYWAANFPALPCKLWSSFLLYFKSIFFFFFFFCGKKERGNDWNMVVEIGRLRWTLWGLHRFPTPPGMKDLLPQLLQVLLEDDPHLSALPEDCHGLEEIALPNITSLSRDCLHPVTDKGRSIKVWGVIPTLELTVARSDPIRGLHANSSPPSFQSCFLGLPSIGDDLGRTP